ncbi:JAB domain containing [Cryptosporidium sp. chipmunk genotype I]|uniref:JAB domain containing n=1 Tax=Cryptosporidium sp. chipmunk genotype I TaxID=1280935 RepID=UPI00351AA2F0|nr:JAB domain containing [Cryptosporidium sp. chipmunk genotype I]
MKIEFNQASYRKILSHSMKYPLGFIDGVLIGYLNSQNDLIIADSFPLTHGPKLPLMVTLGMQYAQGHCDVLNRFNKSAKLEIVGFYFGFCDEKYLNSEGSNTHLDIISEKLLANNKNSILVTFNGKKTSFKESMNVFLLRNKQLLLHTFIEDSAEAETKKLTRDLEYYSLSDFEDHLSSIKP